MLTRLSPEAESTFTATPLTPTSSKFGSLLERPCVITPERPCRSLLTIGCCDVAHHVDRVAAQPADHRGDDIRARAEDVDRVVAFERIQLRALDVHERHVQARAEDAFARDDEIVVERRAEHHDPVEARAAVDADRRVDRVVDRVGAVAAVDFGILPASDRSSVTNARTTNWSLSASPSSRSVPLLWYTLKVSCPSPPNTVVAYVTPGLT